MIRMGARSGNFFVNSFYFSLASRQEEPYPHSIVWNSWALIRIRPFFLGINLG